MKNVLFLFLFASFVFNSCSENSSGDENEEAVIPKLEFSYSVTGHTNQSDSWESPENNPQLAGHTRGVVSNHSTSMGAMTVSGTGPEYGFSVAFETANIEQGTYSLGGGGFNDSSGSYPNFQSGTFRIDEAEINFTANGQTYYIISGSFSAELQDGFTPPHSIMFTAEFTGLSVVSL